MAIQKVCHPVFCAGCAFAWHASYCDRRAAPTLCLLCGTESAALLQCGLGIAQTTYSALSIFVAFIWGGKISRCLPDLLSHISTALILLPRNCVAEQGLLRSFHFP